MRIAIQGNFIGENDIHHYIIVSDGTRWPDQLFEFGIDSPQFENYAELADWLETKEQRIADCIQYKLDNGTPIGGHPNDIPIERPDLLPPA